MKRIMNDVNLNVDVPVEERVVFQSYGREVIRKYSNSKVIRILQYAPYDELNNLLSILCDKIRSAEFDALHSYSVDVDEKHSMVIYFTLKYD